ncbi:hypothetical protein DICPUDRAFT_82219 [Dictyostelium purpureum]|uniref:3'(2'),5'-bisphosphate nucleotidase n=1 Tax=Dictyostelium purpureum TaxID=5786 RepID=F0ZVV6_DICPU|nr:uncharacterized protein DICPUDRAFT_82219 [Dictyostelium purpureum]EGC31911.1 hypothetical protein DICPUDRAFT_82219 [Dictyostelium purpureum]|eukprot:XP_003291548.1 hypothetical protein DICPUDRAFT_82219 [Dictyostelium purpureum]
MNLIKIRSVAINAVEKACRACLEIQSQLISQDTINKKDQSPVTVGDYTVQALVINEIIKNLEEEYPFIAEEDSKTLSSEKDVEDKVLSFFNRFSGESFDGKQLGSILDKGNKKKTISNTNRWWTLDPIDGTLGFLRKDQYAVALALMEDNKPILGILGCPSLPISKGSEEKGCIFVGMKGSGSFMKPLSNIQTEQSISVSDKSDPTKAVFTESFVSRGFGHELNQKISKDMGVTEEPLKIDSQCKYAMVARGDSDCYLRLTQMDYRECIWDHAAGHIIVEEAGGVVTDFKGNQLDYSKGYKLEDNVGIVCSNKNLHNPLFESIKKSIQL